MPSALLLLLLMPEIAALRSPPDPTRPTAASLDSGGGKPPTPWPPSRERRLIARTDIPALHWLDEIFDTPSERVERSLRKRANTLAWGRFMSGQGPDPKRLGEEDLQRLLATEEDVTGEAPLQRPAGDLPPIVPTLLAVAALASLLPQQ
mmetsp:Transcript_36051/g.116422  ORF Transcript_36051/g.116422 Transcript_36051/m.116422 type:complete len:149 (+) Transcript_36051:61-507(+)